MAPTTCGLLFVVLLVNATFAHARTATSDPVGWEFSPFYGYRSGGEIDNDVAEQTAIDLDVDGAPATGFLLEFPSGHHTQWQILYTRQKTEVDIVRPTLPTESLDLEVDYLHFGGTYVLDGDRQRPYVGFSFGGTRFQPEGDYDEELEFSIAFIGGIKFRLTEYVGLRFDVRALGTLTDAGGEFACSGGCVAQWQSSGFFQYDATVGLNVYF